MNTQALTTPRLMTRLASMLYESLLLLAVLFIGVFAFSSLTLFKGAGALKPLFQLYVLAIIAGYFFYFWRKSGQTLAMKTWHIKLVSADGAPITYLQCTLRLLTACVGVPLFFTALFDRDQQFLHDRIAKTRLVLIEKK